MSSELSVSVVHTLWLGKEVEGQETTVSLPSGSTLNSLRETVWKQRGEELKSLKSCEELVVLEEKPSQQLFDVVDKTGRLAFVEVCWVCCLVVLS